MSDSETDPTEAEGADEAPAPGSAQALLQEAEMNRRRALASMSLVHKEHFALLFANCFFLAGSLAAWNRAEPGQPAASGALLHGLDTIRGAAIFALAIYGFWVAAVGLYTKRTVVWPFLLNALLALWVGLGGVITGFKAEAFDKAMADVPAGSSYLAKYLAGPGSIAPGFWMLAAAGVLVLFLILKGLLGGASKSKSKA
jgi:hypothetical protein